MSERREEYAVDQKQEGEPGAVERWVERADALLEQMEEAMRSLDQRPGNQHLPGSWMIAALMATRDGTEGLAYQAVVKERDRLRVDFYAIARDALKYDGEQIEAWVAQNESQWPWLREFCPRREPK